MVRITQDDELLKKNLYAFNSSVRNILADKELLSYILNKFVEEYKHLDIESVKSLIDNIHTNDEVYKIYGLSNEDTSFIDGSVKYDLLFTTRLPNSNDKIGMLINLELQAEGSDTDLKRMIYYCSRMISSEKDRIFKKDEYKDIVKVGAIWICVKNQKELGNCINVYSINERNVKGNYKEDISNYDLMEIITLYLGDKFEIEDLDPLIVLFKSNLKPKEIIQELKERYDIQLHIDTNKEVESMCNLGEGILKNGILLGIQQGIEQGRELGIEVGRELGIEQGEINGTFKLILKKMESKQLNLIDAMIDLCIDEKDYPIYEKLYQNQ